MDITIIAKKAEIYGTGYQQLSVELSGIDMDDLIALIPVDKFVDYHKNYNVNGVLDAIGVDEVKEYFELIENTESDED